MPDDATITPRFFSFLEELRANNNREWFTANKPRYEADVRDPFLHLLADLAPLMREVDPAIVIDPRPVGGSMLRIYRDIRFSKDKTPYKTGVAAHFGRAEAAGAGPAYYLHLAPGESMLGVGAWQPDAATLQRIREAIAADPDGWQKAARGRHFGSACGLIGESLQRAPRGFDPQHPVIHDIKRRDFAISVPLAESEVCASAFAARIAETYRAALPFTRFLERAMQ